MTADDGREARIRQLEARVAELASESSANETAYSHQCHKTASFESEAEDLRKQFDAARHTLVGISDARLEDWQAILERAETAEERVRHLEGRITLAEGDSDLFLCDRFDKSVCDAVEAVPDTLLHDWVDLNLSRSGRLTVIATAELARREARAKNTPTGSV
jgi:DNA repair exonuclease SbcCD ATPase subunit